MSVNFPLILVLATAFTGIVWLVDVLVFRPKRLGSVAAAGDLDEESRKAILAEPLIVEYPVFRSLPLFWFFGRFCSNPFRSRRVR